MPEEPGTPGSQSESCGKPTVVTTRPKDVNQDNDPFPTAEYTRPRIDVPETQPEMEGSLDKKRQKLSGEYILCGEDWLEMARAAKKILDEEGDPVGSLGKVADVWESHGCSKLVLEWMREGVPMLMESVPGSHGGRPNYVKQAAMDFANEEVSRLLLTMAVEADPDGEATDVGYVFPLGAVPKPHSDKFRLVTDITDKDMGPNAYMHKMSFKLEHVDDLLSQIGHQWWGIVFDLRAGFHHLLVREEDRKWLRFKWGGKNLRFRAMPFGPRHSPFFFCKTMREFVKILRRGCTKAGCTHTECRFRAAPNGVVVVSYVDDFAIAAATKELAMQVRDEIITPLLKELGLVRALDKGSWEPKQVFDFLGFTLDTIEGVVLVPEEKLEKYSQALDGLLGKKKATPREVASIAGKMVSVMRAFAPALIYVRSAFQHISKHVQGPIGWSRPQVLTEEVKADLKWLRENLRAKNGRFMWRPKRVVILSTDAAGKVGWGATLWLNGVQYRAQGIWSKAELEEDIHMLEMMGILNAVVSFRDLLLGRNMQIVTDNMICRNTLPKGSRVESLTLLIKKIHDTVCSLDATIVDVAWIPSELNIIPDWLSRYEDWNDWCLKTSQWERVLDKWPGLKIDRFTSGPRNSKLSQFNSRWASEHCQIKDSNAMAQDWKKTFSYACPPLAMIGDVLTLIKEQKARAVLVCPEWRQKPWYPLLQMITVQKIYLGSGQETFSTGASGQCPPHKNPAWRFWAIEVDGSKFPTGI